MKEHLQQGLAIALCLIIALPAASAQTPVPVAPAAQSVDPPSAASAAPADPAGWQSSGASPQSELSYRLGAGDQITISVVELEDLQLQQMRIGSDGIVGLPLVGRVQAAGYTVKESLLAARGEAQAIRS